MLNSMDPFFFNEEPEFKVPWNIRFVAVMLTVILMALACSCSRPIVERYYSDSTTVYIRDSIIRLPGSVITRSVNLDSILRILKAQLKPGVIHKPYLIRDTTKNTELRLLFDRMGNLTAECVKKDEFIINQAREISRLRKDTSIRTVTVSQLPWWAKWALILLAGIILILIGIILILAIKSGLRI